MLPTDLSEVTRPRLRDRIAALTRATSDPGGTLVERGRWFVGEKRWDEAIAAASEFANKHPESPLSAEARYLAHRAQLEKALELADADRPDATAAPAIEQLERLSREPMDAAVAAAKVALGTLVYLAGAVGNPDELVREGLRDWQTLDRAQPPAAPRGALERDVVEIRNVVFQPQGGGIFSTPRARGWNAFRWESTTAPFMLVAPVFRVKLANGETTRITAQDPFPDLLNVVFYDDERRALLERIMLKLGGTKKRPWVQVMQTPNQPAGASLNVLALWKRSFWAQPGHWGGWVFETYPIINEIEFIDAARTKAAVKVTVGYSGATVQMEKRNGAWVASELTNFWIT